MIQRITVQVQGSAAKPYTVVFCHEVESLRFWVTCTCAAAKKGWYCKHRLNLLRGVIDNAIGLDLADLERAMAWAKIDGRLLEALDALDAAEAYLFTTQDELSAAKKRLAARLIGRE